MSVWQRIANFFGSFSDASGLAGALSHAFDPDSWLPGGRDAAFSIALVALSAKMAVADGVVSAAEERVFRRLISYADEDAEQIERLFLLAQQDVAGYQSYAKKIGRLFANSPETLEQVLNGLFYIAAADGMIHENELAYLKDVSDLFGFDDELFAQIAAQHVISKDDYDPYLVLGLTPDASDDEVRRVYRSLVRENHPDRLIAKGVPEEMLNIATGRMAAINQAYSTISSARGL